VVRSGRPAAYPVYLILESAGALFFSMIATINLVYQIQVAGLGPLQLVLVGTMLESCSLIFQIPTGLLADVYSRRLAVVAGMLLTGVGFLIEGAFPVFVAILLSQVVWGVGYTLTDGAQQAWIAGEVGEERVGNVYLRGAQAGQLGTLIGAPISVALASIRLNVPVLCGGALFLVLGVFLALTMPERGFHPPHKGIGAIGATGKTSWQAMGETFASSRSLLRRRPVLITFLAIAAIYGMSSEGFDRLWQIHLLHDIGVPGLFGFSYVVWFGLISVVTMLLSILATEIVRRRVDTTNHRAVAWTLFGINALRIAAIVVFGIVGSFGLALAAFWTNAVLRRTNIPIYTAWLTRSIDARVRATVLSMSSMADSIGQIAGGPVIGAVGSFISLPAALVATGSILAPALPLFTRAVRQERDEPLPGNELAATELD
jgi:DHA3 family tetracycline resistance protein-like MFS transporter